MSCRNQPFRLVSPIWDSNTVLGGFRVRRAPCASRGASAYRGAMSLLLERSPRLARFVEGALEFLWPARCVGCDEPGTLLCEACAASLPVIDQRYACPHCGAPFGWLVCTNCAEPAPELERVASAFAYEGVAERLVKVYKDDHERRLAPVLAEALRFALENLAASAPEALPSLDAIAFIPATEEAYLRRGFDHMELVARELSKRLDVPVADVLIHHRSGDQRELGGEERAENVRGSFEVAGDVWGSRLLLVDDVITTGASLRESARSLVARGATVPLAASVARVW